MELDGRSADDGADRWQGAVVGRSSLSAGRTSPSLFPLDGVRGERSTVAEYKNPCTFDVLLGVGAYGKNPSHCTKAGVPSFRQVLLPVFLLNNKNRSRWRSVMHLSTFQLTQLAYSFFSKEKGETKWAMSLRSSLNGPALKRTAVSHEYRRFSWA